MNKYKEYREVGSNEWITKWLDTTLTKYLKKHDENQTDIEHILDYFLSKDAPKRISKISYKEALRQANVWSKKLAKKANKIIETDADTKVFLDFKDGFRVVKLITENSYKREGNLMRHCLASYYNSSSSTIYSLRDVNNEPHCTVEVTEGTKGNIQQIKGKGNGSIHPKYVGYVLKFLKKVSKAKIRESELENLGYVKLTEDEWVFLNKNFPKYKYMTYGGTKFLFVGIEPKRK